MQQSCYEGWRNIIRAQLSEDGKKGRGRRFSQPLKDLGLQILHSSPKGYRYLRSMFALPFKTTIRKYITGRVGYFSVNTNATCDCFTLPSFTISNIHQIDHLTCLFQQPVFLQGIISQLGVITSTMTPAERMCTLVLDEMAIKRQFDYDRRHDAIYGVSLSGHAAKQAMVIMVRGILGKWKQASHQQHIVLLF